MTQCERIIRHLQDVGSLTQTEAFMEYGIGRLSSRICELRAAGYPIKSEFVAGKNRFGQSVSFVRYSLSDNTEGA